MKFAFLASFVLGFFIIKPSLCSSEVPCPDGRLCPARWRCCAAGCCSPASSTEPSVHQAREYAHDPWYTQWPILFLLGILIGALLCCLWCLMARRAQAVCLQQQESERDSAGSLYPPPRYSRCGSFHQAPPPYSEVTSKPELYPLVITCGEGENKNGGGNYLMVHYFKNYVIQAPGSLSATSTAESLNSSFICNATNEQEPSFDLELELLDCEMYCDGGCKPRVGASPPARRSPPAVDEAQRAALRGLFTRSPERAASCESPPQPTSPTQTSRDSTLRRHRRLDTLKKRQRKTSLYMPLSLAYPVRSSRISPGARVSSRSAPATPCGALVPNLLAFGQRVSSRHSSKSSKLEEAMTPLIAAGGNDGKDDPKF